MGIQRWTASRESYDPDYGDRMMFCELDDPIHGGNLRKLVFAPGVVAGFVSHFETCPNASQFSAKGKR